MAPPLLTVDNLKVSFKDQTKVVLAVSGISFTIAAGETLALLGESGCGKSLTALAMLQLLPVNAYYHKNSHIWFHGEDLLGYSPHQMRTIRGGKIAIIFQEPMTSLNPVLTIEQQIAEVLIKHKGLHGHHLKNHVINLLEQVGIDNAALRCRQYPHQLSGGQKQRVMIAMAIATEPALLIADEPTTALDVTIQAQILALLKSLQQQLNMAMLLITHDLGVVKQVADKVAVMYAGHFVETAATSDFFQQPLHPYSRKLFESLPNMAKRLQPLQSIKGIVPELKQHWDSCRFAARCPWYLATCSDSEPSLLVNLPHHEVRCFRVNDILLQPTQLPPVTIPPPLDSDTTTTSPVLQVTNLKIHFTGAARLIKAVDGISFALYPGETLAVVGESGCGKTTTGRGLLQLIPVTAGEIQFKNYNLLTLQGKKLQQLRKQMQIIFQDPFSAMNPRMLVSDTIMEGMRAYGLYPNAQQRRTRVVELLEQVGLPLTSYNRYPHQFSGGQRQRICIARALAVEPEIIICDEPTSALDVSVQAQIINLLKKLQQQLGLSYIFISHNLAVVSYIADRIVVMYQGKIVETGATTTLLNHPQHPYTKQLLAAVPTL